MTLNVCIPTLNRNEKLTNCIESIQKAKKDLSVTVSICFSDLEELKYFNILYKDIPWIHCLSTLYEKASTFWNRQLYFLEEDALLYLNDDVLLFEDSLENIFSAYQTAFPNYDGVLGINQANIPDNQSIKCAFGVIGTRFANLFPQRKVFCPVYYRFFLDEELYLYVKKTNKFAFSLDAKILHLHPSFGGEKDSTHTAVRTYWRQDFKNFTKRRDNNLLWGETWEI